MPLVPRPAPLRSASVFNSVGPAEPLHDRLPFPNTLPYLAGPAVSVSSDGRWLLSTRSLEDSDLMLVETLR
jgi:hypothetical protein